jgi:hypothetical protein
MTPSGPALTICIGTTAGWPAVERCIRSFLPDAQATGSEIIVADGSGRPPPTDPEILSAVTWRTYDEKSVMRLVQFNLAEATGQIVATIEDHCTARSGWIAAIFRAHTEHPTAAAIGGAIENGTTATPLEWASYLMTQGIHMAPLENGPTTRIANEANISYKRSALAGFLDDPMGFMTIRVTSALAARGEELINDDRIVVDHHERLGTRATAVIHFDDGRTISGFRRRRMEGGDWLRLLGAPVLPLYRTARVVRNAVRKGRAATVASALPWILVFEYCHEVGEVAGYVAGAGRSPYGLR